MKRVTSFLLVLFVLAIPVPGEAQVPPQQVLPKSPILDFVDGRADSLIIYGDPPGGVVESQFDHYTVHWREAGNGMPFNLVEVASFPYTVESLKAETRYEVRLTVTNAAGESLPSRTLTVTTSDPDDYFAQDPLRLAGRIDVEHRWHSSGEDRFAVWLCDVGQASTVTAEVVIPHLQKVLGDYYDWLSKGRYQPIFFGGEVVTADRAGLSACLTAVRSAQRRLINQGRDEYRSAGNLLVELSDRRLVGLASAGNLSNPLKAGVSSLEPDNGRFVSVQQAGVDGSGVGNFVLAHELGHTLNWRHSRGFFIAPDGTISVQEAGNTIDLLSGASTLVGTTVINRYTSGWIDEEDVAFYDLTAGGAQTFTLRGIGAAAAARAPTAKDMVVIPTGQEGRYYALGARLPVGYDADVRKAGVEIYDVNYAVLCNPEYPPEECLETARRRAFIVNILQDNGGPNPYAIARQNLVLVSAGDGFITIRSNRLRVSVAAGANDTLNVTLTPVTNIPSAPQNVAHTRGENSVEVTWQPPAEGEDGITNYNVYCKGRPSLPVSPASTVVATGATSYRHTLVFSRRSTFCEMWVTAVNGAGEGEISVRQVVAPTAPDFSKFLSELNSGLRLELGVSRTPPPRPVLRLTGLAFALEQSSLFATYGRFLEGLRISSRNVDTGETLEGTYSIFQTNWVLYPQCCSFSRFEIQAEYTSIFGDTYLSRKLRLFAPAAPQNVVPTVSNQAITVTWAPTLNGENGEVLTAYPVTSYTVYWEETNGTTNSQTVSTNSQVFTTPDLEGGIEYSVWVTATNALGESPISEIKKVTLSAAAPLKPVVRLMPEDGSIGVRWAPVGDGGAPPVSYTVGWSPANESGVTSMVVGSDTAYTIPGLINGRSYTVRVTASNALGSTLGDAQSATPATVPELPQNITLTAGLRLITVAWDPPSSDGGSPLRGYAVVFERAGPLPRRVFVPVTQGPQGRMTHDITGLQSGAKYRVLVTAVNAVGESRRSDIKEVTLDAAVPSPPVFILSGQPEQILVRIVSNDDGGAPLSNDDGSPRPPVDYTISWVSQGGSDTGTTTISERAYRILGLEANLPYTVTVVATNSIGSSAPATKSATPTVFVKVSGAPQLVEAVSGTRMITLEWNPPLNDGGSSVTSYKVYWQEIGDDGDDDGDVMSREGAISPYTITGLKHITEYRVWVTAFNVIGESPRSAARLTTPSVKPGMPDIFLELGPRQIEVTWNLVDDGGVPPVTYRVVWLPPNASNSTNATVIAGTAYTITGLMNGQEYTVTVTAINRQGETSSVPERRTPADLPGAPRNVVLTDNVRGLDVEWEPPLDNGGQPVRFYEVSWQRTGESAVSSELVGGEELSYTIFGAVLGAEYLISVKAFTYALGPRSGVKRTTLKDVPGPPVVALTRGNESIDVAWGAVDDGDAPPVTYSVSWSPPSASNSTNTTVTVGTAYTITGLMNGEEYRVIVTASNSRGATRSVPRMETPVGRPLPPRLISAELGPTALTGTINVRWEPPSFNGGAPLTGYRVEWTSSEGRSGMNIPPNVLNYAITGLTNGTAYTVQVFARNAAGRGGSSNLITDLTPAVFSIEAPTNLTSSLFLGTVIAQVEWEPVNNPLVVTYIVYRREVGSSEVVEVQRAKAASAQRVTLRGLTVGSAYEVWVVSDTAPSNRPQPNSARSADSLHHQFRLVREVGNINNISPTASGGNGLYTVNWDENRIDLDGIGPFYYVINLTGPHRPARVLVFPYGLVHPGGVSFLRTDLFTRLVRRGSGQDNHINVTPPGFPFAAPQSVVATPGNTTIQMSWAPPTDLQSPTGYTVSWQRRKPSEAVQSMQVTGTTFTISGLLSSAIYEVWVAANNGDDTGASARHLQIATLPDAPTEVALSEIQGGKAMLTWTAPATHGQAITGYVLSWSPSVSGADGVRVEASPYELVGLDEEGSYLISVQTSNEVFDFPASSGGVIPTRPGPVLFGGQSAAASVGEAAPEPPLMPVDAPGAPTNISVVPGGSGALVVTWEAPADDGGAAVSGYTVSWSPPTSESPATVRADASPYTITGLAGGTPYTVTVAANNSAGTGAVATASPVTAITTPAAPTLDSVVPGGSGELVVAWTAPADTGGAAISGYTVSWSPPTSGSPVTVGADASPYTITGLTGGTPYTVTVAANNSAGTGAVATASPVTAITTPAAPTLDSVVLGGSGELVVAWTAPAETGGAAINGYTVSWSPPTGGGSATVGANASPYRIMGLVNGTPYTVSVAARNSAGLGTADAFAQAVAPEVPAPAVVTLTATPPNPVPGESVTITAGLSRVLAQDVTLTVSVTGAPADSLLASHSFIITVLENERTGTAVFTPDAGGTFSLTATSDSPMLNVNAALATVTVATRDFMASLMPQDVVLVRTGATVSADVVVRVTPYPLQGVEQFEVRLQGSSGLTLSVDTLMFSATSPQDQPVTVTADASVRDGTVTLTEGSKVSVGTLAVAPLTVNIVRQVDVVFEEDGSVVTALTAPAGEISVTVTTSPRLAVGESVSLVLSPNGDGFTLDGVSRLTLSSTQPTAQVRLFANSPGQASVLTATATPSGVELGAREAQLRVTTGNPESVELLLTPDTLALQPGGSGRVMVTTRPLLGTGQSLILTPTVAGDSGLTVPVSVVLTEDNRAREVTVSAAQDAMGVHAVTVTPMANGLGVGEAETLYVSVAEDIWQQQFYLKASNAETGDQFGGAISISADGAVLAVGVQLEDGDDLGSQSNAGAVYVFRRTESGWREEQLFRAPTVEADARFGASVSLNADGSVLAVGAVRESARQGAVYVFEYDGTAWSVPTRLAADNGEAGDDFGASVALNGAGDMLVAGAPLEDGSGNVSTSSGAVYVFVRGAGSPSVWEQRAYLKSEDIESFDGFGRAVAINKAGDRVVVGVPNEQGGTGGVNPADRTGSVMFAGAVYVWRSEAADRRTWTQEAYIKVSGTPLMNDRFGASVSLNGDGSRLAVGARTSNGSAGGVHIYTRDSTVWSLQASLFPGEDSVTGAGGNFGITVSLDGAGDVLAVGANMEGARGGDSGAAYVFRRNGSVWSEEMYLKASNVDGGDRFGRVALGGAVLAVGATGEGSNLLGVHSSFTSNNSAATSGAVYVFEGEVNVSLVAELSASVEVNEEVTVRALLSNELTADVVLTVEVTPPGLPQPQTTFSVTVAAGEASGIGTFTPDVEGEWTLSVVSDNALLDTEAATVSLNVGTVAVAAPGAPTNISVVPGSSGELVVTWAAPADTGGAAISGYTVSWSPATGGGSTTVGANASSYTITGLTGGTAYTVTVAATNSAGTGTAAAASPVTAITTPVAPTLDSVTVGDSEIVVVWTAGDTGGETPTYRVVWSPADTAGATDAIVTASPYTIMNLANGQEYTVRITATNSAGTTESSAMSATPAGVPSAPVLTLTAGDGQIQATWTAPVSNGAAISEYTLEWDTVAAFNNNVMRRNTTARTYVIGGLTNGAEYFVRVFATNSAGAGAPSEVATASPVAAITAPGAPTNISVVPGSSGELVVTWAAPVDTGGAAISGYTVSWSPATGGGSATVGANASSYTITGLTGGTAYTVMVAATNSAGTGTAATASPATAITTPVAPTLDSVTVGDSEIVVAWTAGDTGGETPTYRVVWSPADTAGATDAIVTASPYTIMNLANGQEYTVRITATNSAGTTESSAMSATPAGVPSAPVLTLTAGDGQIQATWTAPVSNGAAISEYTLEWDTVAAFNNNVMRRNTTARTYVIGSLTNGTEYFVRVFATNSAGAGAASGVMSSTPATVPSVPTNVRVVLGGSGELTVTWEAPADDGGFSVNHYRVIWQIGAGPENNSGDLLPAGGGAQTYTINGLTNGAVYRVRVIAFNSAGRSEPSAVVQEAPAGAPEEVAASLTPGDAMIGVAWSAPGNGGRSIVSYTVYWQARGDTTGVSQMSNVLTVPVSSHDITGLINGGAYEVWVIANNGFHDSAVPSPLPSSVPNGALQVAQGVGVASSRERLNSLSVSWSASPFPATYRVMWTPATAESPAELGAETLAYTITGLTGGVAYTVEVIAISVADASLQSAPSEGVAETPFGVAQPPALDQANVTVGDRLIRLMWEADVNTGGSGVALSGFKVYWRTGSVTQNSGDALINANDYTITSLDNDSEYTVWVTTHNAFGESDRSAQHRATPIAPLGAPRALVLDTTSDESQVTVSYSAPEQTGGLVIDSYAIYARALSATEMAGVIGTGNASGSPVVIPVCTRTVSERCLEIGTPYEIWVVAIAGGMESPQSQHQHLRLLRTPQAPRVDQAVASYSRIEVSWSGLDTPMAKGGGDIFGYLVQWQEQGGMRSTGEAFARSSPFTIRNLNNGSAYLVAVQALGTTGFGASSAQRRVQLPDVSLEVSGIRLEIVGNDGIRATWSDLGNNIEYTLHWREVNRPLPQPTQEVLGESVTEFTIAGLAVGRAYEIWLTAALVDDVQGVTAVGPRSGVGRIFLPGLPQAVRDFDLAHQNEAIRVTWQAPVNFIGDEESLSYTVYWRVEADTGAFSTAQDVESPYTIPGLTNDTPYEVYVAAVYNGQAGAESAHLTATPANVPAVVIEQVQSDDGRQTFMVTWDPIVEDVGGSSDHIMYVVYWQVAGDSASLMSVRTTSTSYTFPAGVLMDGVDYLIYVAQIVTAVEVESARQTALLPSAPGAPEDLVVLEEGNGFVDIQWQPPALNGGSDITHYKVYWQGQVEGALLQLSTTIETVGTSMQAHTLVPLNNGVEYAINVSAINGTVANGDDREGPRSSTVTATPATVPGVPTGVGVELGGSGELVVSWAAPADNGGAAVTTYTVVVDGERAATLRSTIMGDVTMQSYAVTGLNNGQAYRVGVIAINRQGAGLLSNTRDATPAAAPDAPDIRLAPGNGLILVQWDEPPTNGAPILRYEVSWALSSGGGEGMDLNVNGSPYTISGLMNGEDYTVRVVAINRAGRSSIGMETLAPVTALLPPLNVMVEGIDQTIRVAWDAPADDGGPAITDYRIEWRIAGPPPGALQSMMVAATALEPGDMQSATVGSGLTNGVVYSVRVVAVSGARTSESGFVSATPATVAGVPTLDSLTEGDGVLTAQWTAPSDNGGAPITDYVVVANGARVATETATALASPMIQSYELTGLTNGTLYTVSILAVNRRGESDASNERTVTPATVADAPTLDSLTEGAGVLTAQWTAPSDNGGAPITDYVVVANGARVATETATALASPMIQSYELTGLTNGTPYAVRILAVNRRGESDASDEQTATPATVPGVPTGVDVELGGSGELVVSWAAPTDNGGAVVTTYTVVVDGVRATTLMSTIMGDVTMQSHTLTDLNDGQTYAVGVIAINRVGESGLSNTRNAAPATLPGAPTFDSLASGDGSLTATWVAPADNGGAAIMDYVVVVDDVRTATASATALAPPATQAHELTGLTNGTPYTVKIIAVNRAGIESPPSNEQTATPATVPGVPTALTLTAGDQSVVVAWSPPTDNGGAAVTAYTVTVSAGGESTPATVIHMGASDAMQSTTLSELTNGVEYQVTVTAQNRRGASDPSPAAAATPELGAIRFRIRVFLEGALQ